MACHRLAAALMTACGLGMAATGWLTWSSPFVGTGDAGSLPTGVHHTATGSSHDASPPTRIRGPKGFDAAVVPVAARADGALALPQDLGAGGWWALGAPAGAAHGTVLIAGHVDNRKDGFGPFAALHEMPLGARVEVTMADEAVLPYRITARRIYEQEKLPADLFTRTGRHRLVLITCAGPYDRTAGRYRRNLVLYAMPVTAGRLGLVRAPTPQVRSTGTISVDSKIVRAYQHAARG